MWDLFRRSDSDASTTGVPLGKLDLGLVLPLAFAGFMADAPAARDVIHKRLQHIASVYGSANVRQIEGVLLQVWARRDAFS